MAKKIITYAIDILVVLVILAVGFYGFKLISNKAALKNNKNEEKTILLTVEFEQYKRELLEKIEVGEEFLDSSKNEKFGTVKSISPITDSYVHVSDLENGKYIKATVPEYGMCSVVLECKGDVSPKSIDIEGTHVKIGTTLNLRTTDYVISGKILGIDFEE